MSSIGVWSNIYNAVGWVSQQKTGLIAGLIVGGVVAYGLSSASSLSHEFKQRAALGAIKSADLCKEVDKLANTMEEQARKDGRNVHMLDLMHNDGTCSISFVPGPGLR